MKKITARDCLIYLAMVVLVGIIAIAFCGLDNQRPMSRSELYLSAA